MAEEFQIILPENRMGFLRVPDSFSAEDLCQVQRWLEFNKDLLVRDDDEGGGE